MSMMNAIVDAQVAYDDAKLRWLAARGTPEKVMRKTLVWRPGERAEVMEIPLWRGQSPDTLRLYALYAAAQSRLERLL